MSECFLCKTALEPVNDAEIDDVELCIDCCDNLDAVIRDYLTSTPGGLDLIIDVIADDLGNPESRLKEPLMKIIREAVTEK